MQCTHSSSLVSHWARPSKRFAFQILGSFHKLLGRFWEGSGPFLIFFPFSANFTWFSWVFTQFYSSLFFIFLIPFIFFIFHESFSKCMNFFQTRELFKIAKNKIRNFFSNPQYFFKTAIFLNVWTFFNMWSCFKFVNIFSNPQFFLEWVNCFKCASFFFESHKLFSYPRIFFKSTNIFSNTWSFFKFMIFN